MLETLTGWLLALVEHDGVRRGLLIGSAVALVGIALVVVLVLATG